MKSTFQPGSLILRPIRELGIFCIYNILVCTRHFRSKICRPLIHGAFKKGIFWEIAVLTHFLLSGLHALLDNYPSTLLCLSVRPYAVFAVPYCTILLKFCRTRTVPYRTVRLPYRTPYISSKSEKFTTAEIRRDDITIFYILD